MIQCDTKAATEFQSDQADFRVKNMNMLKIVIFKNVDMLIFKTRISSIYAKFLAVCFYKSTFHLPETQIFYLLFLTPRLNVKSFLSNFK